MAWKTLDVGIGAIETPSEPNDPFCGHLWLNGVMKPLEVLSHRNYTWSRSKTWRNKGHDDMIKKFWHPWWYDGFRTHLYMMVQETMGPEYMLIWILLCLDNIITMMMWIWWLEALAKMQTENYKRKKKKHLLIGFKYKYKRFLRQVRSINLLWKTSINTKWTP